MDATGFAIDEAILIGLISGSILYGAFAVLFLTCIYVLFAQRRTRQPNWILIGLTVAMFIIATTIEALSWSRVLDAFIVYRATLTPIGYFADLGNWKELTRTALLCLYVLCADGALVYRCWVVWNKRLLVVALPIALFLAGIGMTISTIVNLSRTVNSVFASTVFSSIETLLSFTLVQNCIVTTLIVIRIMQVHRASRPYATGGSSSLMPIMSVVIDSGTIYVSSFAVLLACYTSQSNSQWIMIDCMNGIIGIAFTMMTVRIGLGLTPGQSTLTSTTTRAPSSNHGLHPISINVSRSVELEGHSDLSVDLEHDKRSEVCKTGEAEV